MHPIEINDYAALDRLLDDPASRDDVAHGLQQLDAAFTPPSGRLDAIREVVLGAEAALPPVAADGRRPTLPTTGRIAVEGRSPLTDHLRRHPSRRGWLAAAAVVALALGLAGYVYGSGWDGGRAHGDSISAPLASLALSSPAGGASAAMQILVTAAKCDIAPRTVMELNRLAAEATPLPPGDAGTILGRTVSMSDLAPHVADGRIVLTGGVPASREAGDSLVTMFGEFIACGVQPNFGYPLQLFTDDFIRRGFANPDFVSADALRSMATPGVVAETAPPPEAVLSQVRRLADGRVAVLVRFIQRSGPEATPNASSEPGTDIASAFDQSAYILTPYGSSWRIDDVVDPARIVAAASPAPAIPADIAGGTPMPAASAETPISVTPTSCDVTPRARDEIVRIAAQTTPAPVNAEGTPVIDRSGLVAALHPKAIDGRFVLAGGTIPEAQTLAGVTALFGQFAACANEPDINLKFFGLVSDRFITRWASTDPNFVADTLAAASATPQPGVPDVKLLRIDLAQPRLLSDGRVAVIYLPQCLPQEVVRPDVPFEPPATLEITIAPSGPVLILVFENGRWLVDDQIGPQDLQVASEPDAHGTSAAIGDAPASCDVAPRTLDELKRLIAEATPRAAGDDGAVMGRTVSIAELGQVGAQDVVALTGGIAASREEIVVIRGMFDQLVACRGASGIGGALSFYTDGFIRRGFANPDFIPEDDLSAMATPGAAAAEVAVLSGAEVVEARRLADGRVAAIVRFAEPPIVAATPMATADPALDGAIFPGHVVYILKRVGESWRIDDVVGPAQLRDISPPATPMTSPKSMSATATP